MAVPAMIGIDMNHSAHEVAPSHIACNESDSLSVSFPTGAHGSTNLKKCERYQRRLRFPAK
jgi:hypothetical protein